VAEIFQGFEGVIVGDTLNSGSTKLPVTKWNRSKTTRTDNSSGVIRFRQVNTVVSTVCNSSLLM